VTLTLDIRNGDDVTTFKYYVKVEEGAQVKKELEVVLAPETLVAEPMTTLQITVQTKDV
jgi:hypothetical protein